MKDFGPGEVVYVVADCHGVPAVFPDMIVESVLTSARPAYLLRCTVASDGTSYNGNGPLVELPADLIFRTLAGALFTLELIRSGCHMLLPYRF